MLFNEFITDSAIRCGVDFPASRVDGCGDQPIGCAGIPRSGLKRGHSSFASAECSRKTFPSCQPDSKAGKRAGPTRRHEQFNVLELKRKIAKQEFDRAEQSLRMLNRGRQSYFTEHFAGLRNAHTATFGARVYGQNPHELL